jgi:hypothetical protein
VAHQGGDCEQRKGGDDGLGRCLKLLEDGLAGGQLCAQGCNKACDAAGLKVSLSGLTLSSKTMTFE